MKCRKKEKNLNRLELLEEFYKQIEHNKYCYSKDSLMEIPKEEFKEEWNTENEKLKILQEMIEEEKEIQRSGINGDIVYTIMDSHGAGLTSVYDISTAIEKAEEYKRKYIRSFNSAVIYIEVDVGGKSEIIYTAQGYPNYNVNNEKEE